MRENDDRVYIEHILQCIEEVRFHLSGRDKQKYLQNKTVKAAIERTLHIMFESSQRISAELKSNNPDMPWKEMVTVRHVLVHGYLGEIDDEIVWGVVEKELPIIEIGFKRILRELCP